MSDAQLEKLQENLLAAIASTTAKIDTTNTKIETLQTTLNNEIDSIRSELSDHTNRLDKVENEIKSTNITEKFEEMSLQIELLKQDRLRNNLRITGLPETAYDDPDDALLRIAHVLQIDLIPSDYTVYVDRHKSSIIVLFASHTYKRSMINAMKNKQSLFVEELYNMPSNTRIFMNDQLSPYFAKLFQLAWQAKKDVTLYSASSAGGRIRIKKFENSRPVTIEKTDQLQEVIAITDQMDVETQNDERPQHSQASNTPAQANKSPQSIDSASARSMREKPFTHNRQPQQQTNSSTRPPSSHQVKSSRQQPAYPHRYTNPNQQSEPYQKRNSRHVSSLENRSHQPFNKKSRYTTNSNFNGQSQRNANDSDSYRRNYQNRLRSFVK